MEAGILALTAIVDLHHYCGGDPGDRPSRVRLGP